MFTKTLWEDTINKPDENGAPLVEVVVVGQSHDDLSPLPYLPRQLSRHLFKTLGFNLARVESYWMKR